VDRCSHRRCTARWVGSEPRPSATTREVVGGDGRCAAAGTRSGRPSAPGSWAPAHGCCGGWP